MFHFGKKQNNDTRLQEVKDAIFEAAPIQKLISLENIFPVNNDEESASITAVNDMFGECAEKLLQMYDFLAPYYEETVFAEIISDKIVASNVSAAVVGMCVAIFWRTARGAGGDCAVSVEKFINKLKLSKKQSGQAKEIANDYLLYSAIPDPMVGIVLPQKILAAMTLVGGISADPRFNMPGSIKIEATEVYVSRYCKENELEMHRAAAMIGVFNKAYKELYD